MDVASPVTETRVTVDMETEMGKLKGTVEHFTREG